MKKILFVDDDLNLLAALRRQFRKEYMIETAPGPKEGLAALGNGQGFAVVVADMNMPGMNGVEFLVQVRQRAPEVVRLMLTGNADQRTAAEAVNEGSVFRFLSKPCSTEKFAQTLHAAVQQYELIIAEKELLEQTLKGSVQVLTEILSLFDPALFGRTQALQECVRRMARMLPVDKIWELEAAAMLAPIGYVSVPPPVLVRARLGQSLSPDEQSMLARVPEVGSNLVAHIPRLDGVAQVVLYQAKRFDGGGFPQDEKAGKAIPLGARLLKVLADMVEVESKGTSRIVALEHLRTRQGWYDPELLDAAYTCFAPGAHAESTAPTRVVSFNSLRIGHTLASDLETHDGVLIAAKGYSITPAMMERLSNVARIAGIKEPIYLAGERSPLAEDVPPSQAA